MRYLLVVLTHGRSETLGRTLDSFCAMVEPAPEEAYLYVDGPDLGDAAAAAMTGRGLAWTLGGDGEQHGFCDAVANAWADAVGSEAEVDHVFWLENDFVFTRPVDLRELAVVLNGDLLLTQMALCRNACNFDERRAGGLVASRPGVYQPKKSFVAGGVDHRATSHGAYDWLEHRAYWTTNPSLIRRGFMADHPWPDYPSQCEGRYGLDLAAAGYTFGLWGDGEPWVEHIGVRTGHGY